MNPIQSTFQQLKRDRRKALIPFIMGGDPDIISTPKLMIALQNNGADIIEVGIPFSDPLADGPTIQLASARALNKGVTPQKVLKAIKSIRVKLKVPVVCLCYWNLIEQYDGKGPKSFLKAAAAAGVSGLVIPDLSVEESKDFRRLAGQYQIACIFLAAPTSPAARLRKIAQLSSGFIYYVSVMGTTGVRKVLPSNLAQGVRRLKTLTSKPVCVGFGISTPAQASQVAKVADGVIVGSALIRSINESNHNQRIKTAGQFIRRFKRALK